MVLLGDGLVEDKLVRSDHKINVQSMLVTLNFGTEATVLVRKEGSY
jgi:hypothetical protein